MKKRLALMLLITLAVFLFTGCLPGDGSYGPDKPAGIFSGIWHGWIAPVSLIISIFRDRIAIYEPVNTGFWYDFGFYIAILGGFGGFSLVRKSTRNLIRGKTELRIPSTAEHPLRKTSGGASPGSSRRAGRTDRRSGCAVRPGKSRG